MNQVESDEIQRLADLAGLHVEPSDLEPLAREIASILDYVSQIEILVDEETSRPQRIEELGAAVPLRHDVVSSAASIANPDLFAPEFKGGFFVVPRLESIGDG